MTISITRFTRRIFSLVALSTPLTLLVLSACGGGGGGGTPGSTSSGTPPAPVPPLVTQAVSLVNGQAASAVIGQTSFTTSTVGVGGAASLWGPYGSAGVDPVNGNLYVADEFNNRLLMYKGIPTVNGASAVLAIGQSSLTTNASGVSATAIWNPFAPFASGGKLFFADFRNNRVGIYNAVPTSSPGTIDVVVGQASKTTNAAGCSATTLKSPRTVSVAANGKMVVADGANNRVLIWNAVPAADGTAADLVLGQTNMTTCTANTGGAVTASTLNYAGGAWTDGTRVIALDSSNNRVLIWNTFPTANGQAADLVLGQPNFTTSASGVSATALLRPYSGVFVAGATQLFVTDTGNNRVLVWNTFPAVNGQAADVVLGQPNFTTGTMGTTATTLNAPTGVTEAASHVIVSDYFNNRVLVY